MHLCLTSRFHYTSVADNITMSTLRRLPPVTTRSVIIRSTHTNFQLGNSDGPQVLTSDILHVLEVCWQMAFWLALKHQSDISSNKLAFRPSLFVLHFADMGNSGKAKGRSLTGWLGLVRVPTVKEQKCSMHAGHFTLNHNIYIVELEVSDCRRPTTLNGRSEASIGQKYKHTRVLGDGLRWCVDDDLDLHSRHSAMQGGLANMRGALQVDITTCKKHELDPPLPDKQGTNNERRILINSESKREDMQTGRHTTHWHALTRLSVAAHKHTMQQIHKHLQISWH